MALHLRCLAPAVLVLLSLGHAAPATATTATATRCANAELVPNRSNADRVRSATLCLLNAERTRRGLRTLTSERQLGRAAGSHSAQMVRLGFFDHVCPRGSTLNTRVRRGTTYLRNVRRFSLGENIAWGSGSLATPRAIVRTWMRSSGHRRNILDRRFRNVGIGVVTGAPDDVGGAPAATYTTTFGYRVKR
ncbi:MAG: CAP domain-containing protein [Solirubrobacteraceae bacterium]|nr:CAP domain-containing protein [Solirubrobacteraceae bacterium]